MMQYPEFNIALFPLRRSHGVNVISFIPTRKVWP